MREEPNTMYLSIATTDVWCVTGKFPPERFFEGLGNLLQGGDILAVGAYSPSPRLTQRLDELGASQADAGSVYGESFALNRREHPAGRAFELPVSEAVLKALAEESQRDDGQTDVPLFFDHVVAYRPGTPLMPLLSYHDAFQGGELWLSGLYAEAAVARFATKLPSHYLRQRNPEDPPGVA